MIMLTLLIYSSLATAATALAASPALTPTPTSHTQDVTKRCNDGECTYGGTAQTLTANTVTTTVLSTTSVPCYITTYVTDSTTTTSTVYSTDIITSTVTEKGTVTVIQYQPTPILKSSTFESVIQITQTGTTFWQEDQGSAYEKTITGDTQTIGGDTSGGKKDYGNGNGSGNWGASPGTTVLISTAAATGPGSAWTHAAAAEAQGVTTIKADGGVVNTATATGGWANAAAVGTANGAAVNANGVAVQWSGAWTKDDISGLLVILAAVGAVLVFEICHHLG